MRRTAMILALMLVCGISTSQAQVMEPEDDPGTPPLISNETPDERRVYDLKQDARSPLPSDDGRPLQWQDEVPEADLPVDGASEETSEEKEESDGSQDEAALKDPHVIQTICPVSKETLGSMGEPVEYVHNGRVYKLCCPMCLEEFAQNPEKYIAEMEALERETAPDGGSADEQREDDANEDQAGPKVIEFNGDEPVLESGIEMEGNE